MNKNKCECETPAAITGDYCATCSKLVFLAKEESVNMRYKIASNKYNKLKLGEEFDVINTEHDGMKKIRKLTYQAKKLTINESYFEAWEKWSEVVTELDLTIQKTKMARAAAKGVGWLGAVMTGGIGLEDVFLVPLISNGLMKIFGINLKEFLEELERALRARQSCMYRDKRIVNIADYDVELTYFYWCYSVTDEVQSNDQKLKKLLSVWNPFEDDASPKHKYSANELYDLIEENISNHGMNDKKRKLNKYLRSYLERLNKTNNDLYGKLRSMQHDR